MNDIFSKALEVCGLIACAVAAGIVGSPHTARGIAEWCQHCAARAEAVYAALRAHRERTIKAKADRIREREGAEVLR